MAGNGDGIPRIFLEQLSVHRGQGEAGKDDLFFKTAHTAGYLFAINAGTGGVKVFSGNGTDNYLNLPAGGKGFLRFGAGEPVGLSGTPGEYYSVVAMTFDDEPAA
ncbi:hypothetical protein ACVOMV_12790 [Mesorhizobium atlanticum]